MSEMTYFWVIVILLVLLLIAIDPRSWGQWAKEGWTDLGIALLAKPTTDFEVRKFYRRRACEDVPYADARSEIRFPDPTLDRLIYEDKFDEANEYRMRKMMEARQRQDRDAVETYALYKAHISAREAEFEEETRRNLREKYPKLVRKMKTSAEPVYDPTEIVTASGVNDDKSKRSGYLEIEWKRLPVNVLPNPSATPPSPPSPPSPPNPEPVIVERAEPVEMEIPEEPEIEDETGDDEFTDLISV
jgi:hypothetical protein